MYEPSWPISAVRMQSIEAEAKQFVAMMFELWDDERDGQLSEAQFDRAAHQHPLLVQVMTRISAARSCARSAFLFARGNSYGMKSAFVARHVVTTSKRRPSSVLPPCVVTQAFQLEHLDAPPPPIATPSSPLSDSSLKPRPGVYTGLHPGAVSRVDEAYFSRTH